MRKNILISWYLHLTFFSFVELEYIDKHNLRGKGLFWPTVHGGREVRPTGAWGSGHIASVVGKQSSTRPSHLFPFIQFEVPAQGLVPPTVDTSFHFDLLSYQNVSQAWPDAASQINLDSIKLTEPLWYIYVSNLFRNHKEEKYGEHTCRLYQTKQNPSKIVLMTSL